MSERQVRRIWDIVIAGLVISSAVMAAIFGASRSDWNNGSDLILVAFIPCIVAALIFEVRESQKAERDRRRASPSVLPYQRDWTFLLLEAVAAPLVLGFLAALVLVLGVALITHGIVQ